MCGVDNTIFYYSFLLKSFYSNVLFPTLEIDSMQVEIEADKQIISPENTSTLGRQYTIDENLQVTGYNYYAPELKISLKGKGQIKSAYIIYEQNNSMLVQKVKDVNCFWMGISVTPKTLNVTINYITDMDVEEKRIYIVLIGMNNERNIWLGYINVNKKEAEFISSEELFELVLYGMTISLV